ncbi:TetR/AcrR family transcriptional regulator [Hamadaea tsunoensis]|uniref:TetR/AcrR family transcriptional regulator n=1 Tax=Hamadaea tsunoensis TaxID=53368 RepID=UPI0004125EC5|nr:TetR/AcrR family transcriptional regulator [Hamadaea tsunoensis]
MSSTVAADERRERILTAALGVFGRYGFRRTSMDQIAQAAGFSRPAVYQYFGGKEAVFRALGERLAAEVVAAAARARHDRGPVADRLYAALAPKLDLVATSIQPEFRAELFAEAKEVVGDLVADFHDRHLAEVEGLLAEAADGLPGVGTVISARDAALVLVDGLPGIGQEPVPPDEVRRRLRQLIDLVTRGLRDVGPA